MDKNDLILGVKANGELVRFQAVSLPTLMQLHAELGKMIERVIASVQLPPTEEPNEQEV